MPPNSNNRDCSKPLIAIEEGEGTLSVQNKHKQNACATVRGDQFLVENFRFTA